MPYHKFKHKFQDSLNPLCNCSLNTESTFNYILRCPLFVDERKTFLSNIKSINQKFLEKNDSTLTQTLLFDDPAFSVEINTIILYATIQLVLSTKRFEEALLYGKSWESLFMFFTPYYYKCYFLFSCFSFHSNDLSFIFIIAIAFIYFKQKFSCMYFWLFSFCLIPGFPKISWNLVIVFVSHYLYIA